MQLEMMECPKCGGDMPVKRKELGYHVCVNCSTTKPKVAITTVEGSGDHTYNDIIIMDQDQASAIAKKAAEITGKSVNIEMLDLDADEEAIAQEVKDKVNNTLDGKEEKVVEEDDEEETEEVEGIDY